VFDPELLILHTTLLQLRVRLAALHCGQAGYSTEAVIVTALLAIAAITALGYIVNKIVSAAKGVQTK
jgi:putative flippase GtrA